MHTTSLPSGYDLRDALRGEDAGRRLSALLDAVVEAPAEWSDGKPTVSKSVSPDLIDCRSYRELTNAWRRALKWTDGLDAALAVMLASSASTQLVGEQLWFKVISPPATGKTTVVEGLGLDKSHCVNKDTIRGFYSGWRDGQGEDHSLAAMCRGKTLIVKDGDTLLKSPNLGQILSEGRGLYDRVGRTHYRNAVTQDYEGHRMTLILCGTASLREIDESELGCRFLDCVIMDRIDDDFEDDVVWRCVNQEANHMMAESDGKLDSQYPPELIRAMKMTGGYLHWLRCSIVDLLSETSIGRGELARCGKLGKFVAYLRARPNRERHDAEATREFSARLAKQLVRLARTLTVVLNRDRADFDVMRRVRKVALDTARGITLSMAAHLYSADDGLDSRALAIYTNQREQDVPKMLRFLRGIGVVESFRPDGPRGGKGKMRYRLTERMRRLYGEIVDA